MPSFDNVNYSVRPNKNVERKLIFDALRVLNSEFDFDTVPYIGMGSLWFVDFVMAHKILHMQRLISIEHEENAPRSEFNRPYNCISVLPGDTGKVLPEMNLDERCIMWLDYDTGLEGPVLRDAELVLEKVPVGSVFIVTLNAHNGRLPKMDAHGNEQTRRAALVQFAGDLVPADVTEGDLGGKRYPCVLSRILLTHLKRSFRRSGRRGRFYPLFNFAYSDNAPMVTIGGMLVDEVAEGRLEKCRLTEKFDYVTGEAPYAICVPMLTPKEKIALDGLLPSADAPSVERVQAALGFALKQTQIAAYHRFYRSYPVFGEIPI